MATVFDSQSIADKGDPGNSLAGATGAASREGLGKSCNGACARTPGPDMSAPHAIAVAIHIATGGLVLWPLRLLRIQIYRFAHGAFLRSQITEIGISGQGRKSRNHKKNNNLEDSHVAPLSCPEVFRLPCRKGQ
jgi:hypothetical protein